MTTGKAVSPSRWAKPLSWRTADGKMIARPRRAVTQLVCVACGLNRYRPRKYRGTVMPALQRAQRLSSTFAGVMKIRFVGAEPTEPSTLLGREPQHRIRSLSCREAALLQRRLLAAFSWKLVVSHCSKRPIKVAARPGRRQGRARPQRPSRFQNSRCRTLLFLSEARPGPER